MKPLTLRLALTGAPCTIARYQLTHGGHFAVFRRPDATCIEAAHVASGLRLCTFSHLAYRTLKSAVAALDAVQADLQPGTLDNLANDRSAQHHVLAVMRMHGLSREF